MPAVAALVGLTGNSDDSYIKHAAVNAAAAGYRVVVFNHKGGTGTPVTTPQFHSASFTDDLRLALATIHRQFPNAPLLSVGWSMGANVLLR